MTKQRALELRQLAIETYTRFGAGYRLSGEGFGAVLDQIKNVIFPRLTGYNWDDID